MNQYLKAPANPFAKPSANTMNIDATFIFTVVPTSPLAALLAKGDGWFDLVDWVQT